MTTYTGIVQSIAVQAWEQTFAGPPQNPQNISSKIKSLKSPVLFTKHEAFYFFIIQ
jgi:hypothetical protein